VTDSARLADFVHSFLSLNTLQVLRGSPGAYTVVRDEVYAVRLDLGHRSPSCLPLVLNSLVVPSLWYPKCVGDLYSVVDLKKRRCVVSPRRLRQPSCVFDLQSVQQPRLFLVQTSPCYLKILQSLDDVRKNIVSVVLHPLGEKSAFNFFFSRNNVIILFRSKHKRP
jgi:hypothetical protein